MLTFTHTYLINRAYQKTNGVDIPSSKGELVLGNVIPDFVTHLGRAQFQALAHNLAFFLPLSQRDLLAGGAAFHILCDNFSTLGRGTFEGNYHHVPKKGFIEKLARQVEINIALPIPRRRILQCAFDILVIRDSRSLLIELLQAAERFLRTNFTAIIKRMSEIYGIAANRLIVGLQRFSNLYGENFIELVASEEYRLFPLIRSLLDLDTLTHPQKILAEIQNHPELMELVELNMPLIDKGWHELLAETGNEVMKYPGMQRLLMF